MENKKKAGNGFESHELYFVPLEEIRRIRKTLKNSFPDLCRVLADIFRINILYMIRNAGSGHVGTSFSCIDMLTLLWHRWMVYPNEPGHEYSDTIFSSKGHDAPAFYALLTGFEKIDFDLIHCFRRLNGLPGHPDISTPYIVANTGSLGMGISKARGMALANRMQKKNGRFYIICGDGELQEGQVWESLQSVANDKMSEITVIVDHNKIQSDTWVQSTSSLGDIEKKFAAFGWATARCDGHDLVALDGKLSYLYFVKNYRPQVIIADTTKGKGVSFMEKIGEDGLYQFHSGAPSFDDYYNALNEIVERVNANLDYFDIAHLRLEKKISYSGSPPSVMPQQLVRAYGDELVKIAADQKNLVVLDADLVKDCGLISFKEIFSDRFIECGIAEQDMVSVAGGLALRGMLPVVHSFACFLSTRPNEQLYNNATEGKKIIYTATLAGLLPATPGHSHQSVRDISCLGAIPGLTMIQPADENQVRQALRWAVYENEKSTYIRLTSVPVETKDMFSGNAFTLGQGTKLYEGRDAVIIGYGPVMLSEALSAARFLKREGIFITVINLPWLNVIDGVWLYNELHDHSLIFTLDDHYIEGGQGQRIHCVFSDIAATLRRFVHLGLEDIPACGENREVLKHHRLCGKSIAEWIKKELSS